MDQVARTSPTDETQGHHRFRATPYRWPEASSLTPRQWVMEQWLEKGEITAIIGPGGSGKSTICTMIALCIASGEELLASKTPPRPQTVWIYNLEDCREELERQVAAACLYHGIDQANCSQELYLDSGLDQPLCTATEGREGFEIKESAFAAIGDIIREREIGVLIVDPFIASHEVHENSNGSINAIAKRWKRLAHETGCAIILVHHTKKLGGREVSVEDGRGAVALRDAARVVLTLNLMSDKEASAHGIAMGEERRSLIRIDTGKANRSASGSSVWIKLVSQCLDNGSESAPPDVVGVATSWSGPDHFEGITDEHIAEILRRLAREDRRANAQSGDWIGYLIADVTGISALENKERIKAIISALKDGGQLAIEHRRLNGKSVPFMVPG